MTEKPKVQRSRKRVYESVQPDQVEPVTESGGACVSSELQVDDHQKTPHVPVLQAAENEALLNIEPATLSNEDKFQDAMLIVRKWSAWSAGAGLIPLPIVDMAGLMTAQLLMLKKLCNIYDLPFDSQRSKSSLAILLSGVNTVYLAGSSLKFLPFFGLASLIAMPAVNGALTYAVGRVFIQHFASGGTFLDFDHKKVRKFFEEQYREGKLGVR